jgi:predicted DNA binding protein
MLSRFSALTSICTSLSLYYRHTTGLALYLRPTCSLSHMTYYEVTFKLQHDCPYNDFSREYPSATISHWCNWSRDVLEIAYNDLQSLRVKRAIHEMLGKIGSKIIKTPRSFSNLRLVLQHCACDKLPPPTLPTIEKRNCLNLQPMVYAGGWEWYRITAFSDQDVRSLFKDLEKRCTVEVTSRRAISEDSVHSNLLVSTRSLFGDMTGKQVKALVTALDHGYYNLPRSTTAEEIARRLGIPRTSFTDHLRKAQNKVIQAVGAYVRLQIPEPSGTGSTRTDV